ncbi:MAG TPA: nitroreductase family protein [Candidatus Limnocylindrales bacterium]|nr:nitroreductase family protein [Candidatus Limnocylindrales bacterium]
MDADRLLTTTRSVRKRLDYTRAVSPNLIQECIEIAIQAPTGSNQQTWSFLVIYDQAKKKALADLYRRGFELYAQMPREERPADDPRQQQMPRVVDSAVYLAQTMEQAPVFVIPCIEGRFEEAPQFAQASMYGSILPAVWSFMLAARARGLGSAWTTIHLMFEQEAAELLGIPRNVTQAALLPVAYFTGDDFKPAKRIPAREVTYWDTWGARR